MLVVCSNEFMLATIVCVWFWKYGLVWFGRFGALCLGLDFRMIDQFEEDLVMDIVECVFLDIIWI